MEKSKYAAGEQTKINSYYTFGKKFSGGGPDVALGTGKDPNLVVVAFSLTFFRHLNDPLELGVDVVVAQSYWVDDDIQNE